MIPEEKVSAIRNHLKSEFSNHEIQSNEDLDDIKFILTHQGETKIISFKGSFIKENNLSELSKYLQQKPFAWYLRNDKIAEVTVTHGGQQKLKYRDNSN